MKPESLLPCSQEPSTGTHPEPDRTSPYQPKLSLYDPPTYVLAVSEVFLSYACT
jgi:hypothetical protein